MKKLSSFIHYFTIWERVLWSVSVVLIVLSFILFDRSNYMTLFASLIGVTSLIFCAKGNPAGPLLMIIFCIIYGVISYSFAYYGEMITYLGMSLPMSVICFLAWYKNPYKGNKKEVAVGKLQKKDLAFMMIITLLGTVLFYYILKLFHTANLIPSTISIATSFIAVYLSAKRSPYFALGYAANDLVLIVLWVLASMSNVAYIPVAVCFLVFLINDLYGFFAWLAMEKRQQKNPGLSQ